MTPLFLVCLHNFRILVLKMASFSLPTRSLNIAMAPNHDLHRPAQVVQKYIKSITNNAAGAPKGGFFFLGGGVGLAGKM